jgi:hypothetical protein
MPPFDFLRDINFIITQKERNATTLLRKRKKFLEFF